MTLAEIQALYLQKLQNNTPSENNLRLTQLLNKDVFYRWFAYRLEDEFVEANTSDKAAKAFLNNVKDVILLWQEYVQNLPLFQDNQGWVSQKLIDLRKEVIFYKGSNATEKNND